MKQYDYYVNEYGEAKKVPKNLKKLLNLQYLRYTNKTFSAGKHDLPVLKCTTKVLPDYIASYSCPSEYHKTPYTAVAFYKYDNVFDGKDGLYNAIYYNDEKLLSDYKEKFAGVKFIIAPDYSELGDLDDIENNYRLKKARVVALWFVMEIGAIVIPNITYPTIESIGFSLDGLDDCTVVAFSTMGYVTDSLERNFLKEAVKYTVDQLNLKAIIVFDICGDNDAVEDIFAYAVKKGINVVVPPNMMKLRNTAKKGRAAHA